MNATTPAPSTSPHRPAAAPAVTAPDADLAIVTEDLTKTFTDAQGSRTVVEALNLTVPRGAIYGFLGPNGSGKSTTMKMLLGLLAPTRGRIRVLGRELTAAGRRALMARTGSLIEQPPGYGHLTGAENMRIVQRMLGLSQAQVVRALELVRLTEHQHRLVRTYSLGMKQRLGIAIALAREPELLILDEPTNGLDPSGIEEVRRLLLEMAERGVTVMVSSHQLDEIERISTVLGILSGGRMVFQGSHEQLMARSAPDLVIRTPQAPRALGLAGEALSGLRAASVAAVPGGLRVAGLSQARGAELVRRLAIAGIPLTEMRRESRSLEEVFMDLTGRGGAL